MFPSIEDLRQKFERAKYIVDEVTISQVYVAGELQKAGPYLGAAGVREDGAGEGAGVRAGHVTGAAPVLPGD